MPKLVGLRELRERRGLTQQELAEQVNATHGLISQYENGITSPSMARATKLARFFGVTLDDLFINPAESQEVRR